jgi:hypothetical protein
MHRPLREPSRREGDSFPKRRTFGNDLHQHRAIADRMTSGGRGDGKADDAETI